MTDDEDRITPGPFSSSLGFELMERTADRVVMEATPGPEHANGGGILHGGYLAALLDSTTGWAVHNALPDARPAPHTHMSIQYLRMGMPGERVRCVGVCVRAGRRVAAAEAELSQGGKVLARAVTTHVVIGTAEDD